MSRIDQAKRVVADGGEAAVREGTALALIAIAEELLELNRWLKEESKIGGVLNRPKPR